MRWVCRGLQRIPLAEGYENLHTLEAVQRASLPRPVRAGKSFWAAPAAPRARPGPPLLIPQTPDLLRPRPAPPRPCGPASCTSARPHPGNRTLAPVQRAAQPRQAGGGGDGDGALAGFPALDGTGGYIRRASARPGTTPPPQPVASTQEMPQSPGERGPSAALGSARLLAAGAEGTSPKPQCLGAARCVPFSVFPKWVEKGTKISAE